MVPVIPRVISGGSATAFGARALAHPTSVDRTFSALSDSTRRSVIDLLRGGARPAGDLAEALQLKPAALSRHLRILRRADLIMDSHPDHDARVRLYQLRPEAFATLRDWLDQVEMFWTTQLSAFADHIDRGAAK